MSLTSWPLPRRPCLTVPGMRRVVTRLKGASVSGRLSSATYGKGGWYVRINLGALNRGPGREPVVHPRDIFNALPNKPRGMDYLRGPQDQVLQEWWSRRHAKDLVIKMNTGGGKTIVGLLVAQSSLAEGAGPAAYLVPDHYLAEQVTAEAERLGIEVTDNARDMAYARGRAILVDVFQRLFNGQSIFGVDGSAGRTPAVQAPGTIIIDDAHACLRKAEDAFRLSVPRGNPVYDELLDVFKDALEQQSPASYLDLADDRSRAIQIVPYWAWIDRQRAVLEALHPLSREAPYIFAWPLLVDILPDCRAVFTARALEIAAPCVNSDVLPGFRQAGRRVYLTATLADDGVLVTDFGAEAVQVAKPIVPANAGDIGDRLILVPQQTHPAAYEDETREVILGLAEARNVAVIVPSGARAGYWEDDATMVLDKDNLAAGVERMRADPYSGLYVLVNRYDGVDLPGDACHVLVIDGLPEALDGVERADAAQLSGTSLLTARQVQRLEQGMGRATRSNEDYCVVFLLGARLAERLHGPAARASFSPATLAQIELSEDVEGLIAGTDVSTLRQVAQQCLDRDPDWLAASRGRLATLRYGEAVVTPFATGTRAAFGHAAARDYPAAVAALRWAVNDTGDPAVRAYLMQQLAAYQHHIDPAAAQQTQKSANAANRNLLRPLEGVRYEKLSAPAYAQGAAAAAQLQAAYDSGNDLVLGMNALLADLEWAPRTRAFEQAWADLARVIGFASQQPEHETGRGPDGLWAVTGGTFYVIEAKSGVKEDHPVYKSSAEQLSNAMDWFTAEYTTVATAVPVLIHPRAQFHRQAAVPHGCKVVTAPKLTRLRDALRKLVAELADGDAFRDPDRVGRLLTEHRLTASAFLDSYTQRAIPGQ